MTESTEQRLPVVDDVLQKMNDIQWGGRNGTRTMLFSLEDKHKETCHRPCDRMNAREAVEISACSGLADKLTFTDWAPVNPD